jgi:hypothetical protein
MAAALALLNRLKSEEAEKFVEFQKLEALAIADHADEVKELRRTIDKSRRARLSGKAKEGDEEREVELKHQLEELIRNAPEKRIARAFRINDATIEALQDILKVDFSCILFDRDELSGMLSQ